LIKNLKAIDTVWRPID